MSTITITRGSDQEFRFEFTDEDNDPIPLLEGSEVNILDTNKVVEDRFSGEVTDAAGGVVVVSFEGTSPIKVGSYKFRVQVTGVGGNSIATLPMTLKIV
jgi:hypothetical protein